VVLPVRAGSVLFLEDNSVCFCQYLGACGVGEGKVNCVHSLSVYVMWHHIIGS
jgi:hypothetical protein